MRAMMRTIERAWTLAGWIVCASAVAQTGAGLGDLTRAVDGRSGRVSSAAPEAWSNRDNLSVPPGETRTLADIRGPGMITHLWLTFSEARPNWISAEGSADPSQIVLRMYWDGAAQPAVESPLGDFFAAGFGQRVEVNSVPVQVQEGDAYNCFWQMPFHKRALVTLTNESDKRVNAFYYHVDYVQVKSLPRDTAYFCAQYRQEFPQKSDGDYLIADIKGKGHYVGTVISVRSRSPEWFGEGDDKFYVDGEAHPSIWGTGTEDYLLSAWGLSKCTFPYFGVPLIEGQWGDVGWEITAYRWHIADPVRFTKSLRVEIEHTGWMSADETSTGKIEGHVTREDDMATVAFWYQVGQPKRFTTLPPAAERVPPNLDIIYEGTALLAHASSSPGEMTIQKGYDWTGAGQLFFVPREGAPAITGEAPASGSVVQEPVWLETRFNVEKEELRRLILRTTHSYDYGVIRVLLDGSPVLDRLDLYSAQIEVHDHSLGDRTLSKGEHMLRMECVGQNSASTGRRLGVDSIRLRQRWLRKRPPLAPPSAG